MKQKLKTVDEIRHEIAHLDHCIAECKRHHDAGEVRRAAEALGLEHMLPDPICLPLDLKRAA